MKPQDLLFVAVFAVLAWKKDPKLFIFAGILSLLISIPLFSRWIFFTAERLTWYAAAFFLIAIIKHLIESRKKI